MTKFCAQCKHYQSRWESDDKGLATQHAICMRLCGEPNPITGEAIHSINCEQMRMSPELCGWDGQYWEQL